MKCQNIIRNTLVLSLLASSVVVQAFDKQAFDNVDKILKKDLDTILLEMKKHITPELCSEFDKVGQKIINDRNCFFDESNNEGLDVHVVKMESNLVDWSSTIVNDSRFSNVHAIAQGLQAKFEGSLQVFKKYVKSKADIITLGKLGAELNKFASMLPKKFNDKLKLLKVMTKRLNCNNC